MKLADCGSAAVSKFLLLTEHWNGVRTKKMSGIKEQNEIYLRPHLGTLLRNYGKTNAFVVQADPCFLSE